MTYTFSLVADTKGGYFRYQHASRSIYVPKTMFAAEPAATISITAEGIAEPKAAKAHDPVALQVQATKAAERAARAAERAQKLAEQLEQLKAAASVQQPAASAQQPEAKAAGRGKKAKAA